MKGLCKRGHAGPVGANCGECLMSHVEVVPFYESAPCVSCGATASTHPDAASPLNHCGDCGRVVCSACADGTTASRCQSCAERSAEDAAARAPVCRTCRAASGEDCRNRAGARLGYVHGTRIHDRHNDPRDPSESGLSETGGRRS